MGKLNAAKLRTLTKPGTFGDGAGLYLQVRGAEQRSWLYRFKLHGKPHLMGLGTAADVSLAEARDAAAAARKLVRQGADPIARRRAERADAAGRAGLNTFAEVAPVRSGPNSLRHFRDRGKAQLPQAFARWAWGFDTGTIR